jgi:hypothetical protein
MPNHGHCCRAQRRNRAAPLTGRTAATRNPQPATAPLTGRTGATRNRAAPLRGRTAAARNLAVERPHRNPATPRPHRDSRNSAIAPQARRTASAPHRKRAASPPRRVAAAPQSRPNSASRTATATRAAEPPQPPASRNHAAPHGRCATPQRRRKPPAAPLAGIRSRSVTGGRRIYMRTGAYPTKCAKYNRPVAHPRRYRCAQIQNLAARPRSQPMPSSMRPIRRCGVYAAVMRVFVGPALPPAHR